MCLPPSTIPSCGHEPLALKETPLDCSLPLPATLILNSPSFIHPAKDTIPVLPVGSSLPLQHALWAPPTPQAASLTDFLLARSSDLTVARDSESEGLGRSSVTHQLCDSEQTEALLWALGPSP